MVCHPHKNGIVVTLKAMGKRIKVKKRNKKRKKIYQFQNLVPSTRRCFLMRHPLEIFKKNSSNWKKIVIEVWILPFNLTGPKISIFALGLKIKRGRIQKKEKCNLHWPLRYSLHWPLGCSPRANKLQWNLP